MPKLIRPRVNTTSGAGNFDFRLRFNMLKGDHISSESKELQLMRTPEGQVIRLRAGSRGTRIRESSEVAILGGPYPSAEEAEKTATRFRQAVLMWAVRERLGLNFGDGILRSVITDFGKKFYEDKLGHPIRNDRLGIDVYESDKGFLFGSVDIEGGVGKNVATFTEYVCQQSHQPLLLTEKQILAAELYSASFFDVPFRSRFITLVTAIEALLDAPRRSDAVQFFVDNAKTDVRKLKIDETTKEAIVGSIERIRYDSIGQTGKNLCEKLLANRKYAGRSPGSFFKYCYRLRSEIVHNGRPSETGIDLLQIANVCQGFVGDLLDASFGLGEY